MMQLDPRVAWVKVIKEQVLYIGSVKYLSYKIGSVPSCTFVCISIACSGAFRGKATIFDILTQNDCKLNHEVK